mmetsp:Transcript_10320/g.19801  ORF Transcript_10320/g.19801 Transcript_10320/m.19801 type:complete len:248 (+) Transcript_10320:494-1237(+)
MCTKVCIRTCLKQCYIRRHRGMWVICICPKRKKQETTTTTMTTAGGVFVVVVLLLLEQMLTRRNHKNSAVGMPRLRRRIRIEIMKKSQPSWGPFYALLIIVAWRTGVCYCWCKQWNALSWTKFNRKSPTVSHMYKLFRIPKKLKNPIGVNTVPREMSLRRGPWRYKNPLNDGIDMSTKTPSYPYPWTLIWNPVKSLDRHWPRSFHIAPSLPSFKYPSYEVRHSKTQPQSTIASSNKTKFLQKNAAAN